MTQTLTSLLHQAIAERIFPGCVLLATRDGVPLLHAAFGTTMYTDPDSRPVARDDIFDLASLTKVFTATAALMLHDAGELALDAEARRYLPELEARGVTLRHLLSHSSGLDLRLSTLRAGGPPGIWKAAFAAEPTRAPGSFVAYSNINSLLLGAIVAAVARMPLNAVVGALVLEPLGMRETGFCPPAALRPRIPPTEWDDNWREGLVHGTVHDESAAALGGVAGHAGLFGTASDVERLLRLWLQRGSWGGRQLLREATVAEALRDQTAGLPTLLGPPVRSGLGWMLDRANFMGALPAGSFGHTGFTGPAMVGTPATGMAFVLLSNRTYPRRTPPPYRHHTVTAAALGLMQLIRSP